PEDGGGAIAALVTKHDGQRLSVATGRRRTEADHHAGTRRNLARAERAQRCEARAVLVAQWQVEERVADGGEAFLRQLGGTLRPRETRARLHALSEGGQSHEGHLSTDGRGVGPLPSGDWWRAATPHR